MKLKIYCILSTIVFLLSGCNNSFLPTNKDSEINIPSTFVSSSGNSDEINSIENNESEEDKKYDYLKFEAHEDGYYVVAGLNKNDIEEIVIPDYYKGLPVTTIKKDAFFGYQRIKKATLGKNISNIESYAFYHTGIEEITIPEKVNKITYASFSNCNKLKNINFHENVKEIESMSFANCISLKKVVFPEYLSILGGTVFSGCTSLESVVINDNLEILEGLNFNECTSLKSIVFGKKIKSIGWKAFEGCTSLKEIEIPEHILFFESQIFKGCLSLEKVNYLAGETSEYMFSNCTSLVNISFSNNLYSIRNFTFENCTILKEIVIPKSIEHIGENAFKGCTSLTKIYFEGTEEQWNAIDIHEVNEDLFSKEIVFNYSK